MIKGLIIGHTCKESSLQDIGSKNNIEIFGNHFIKGKIVIHIWNKNHNAWLVFERYEHNKGSVYKCVYNE